MNTKSYIALVLLCGLLLPIYAEEKEIPEDVGKFADEHMEPYVAKQGRRLSSGERSVTDAPDAKKVQLCMISITVFLMALSAVQ